MNFEELKTIFANLYEQTSAPSSGADVRNRFINLACTILTRRYPWSWRKAPGTGTADGTFVFALEDDFDAEGIVTDTFLVGGELWTEIVEEEVSIYSSDSTVFYITGNDKDGYDANFPCAVPDNLTAITYRYFRKHPELVDDEDITIIPDGECICNLAVGRFLKSEGEGDEAYTWLQDAENGVEDMKKEEIRRKPIRRKRKRTGRSNNIENIY